MLARDTVSVKRTKGGTPMSERVMKILDPRAAPGKRYHQVMLEALPDMPIAETIEDIHSFFRIHKGPDYFLPQNDTEDN